MNYEMYSESTPDETDKVVLFMQQMIPHHANAVNMAKFLLKQGNAEAQEVDDLKDILYDIINTQNYQIHQFRNYLNPKEKLLHDTTVVLPTSAGVGFFVNTFVTIFSGAAMALAMMM